MDLIKFINKNTYEVTDSLDDYIFCDWDIANIIASLNKKGYKTKYSCSGHNHSGLLWAEEKILINEYDKFINENQNDNSIHIIRKDDNYYYHKDEVVSTNIYISFDKEYDFVSYPKDFNYRLFNDVSYIYKEITYFKDENHSIRKSDREIYDELKDSWNTLEEWSNILPYI